MRGAAGRANDSSLVEDASECFQVFVRIRPPPPSSPAIDPRKRRTVLTLQDNSIYAQDPYYHDLSSAYERGKKFAFDGVFNAETSNQRVFGQTLKQLLPNTINGYNTCCFAFGMTGSGKTHTMLGDIYEPEGEAGIVSLAMEDIFSLLKAQQTPFSCKLSYMEIYNENVQDLLTKPDSDTQRSPGRKRLDASPMVQHELAFDIKRTRSTSQFRAGGEKRNTLRIQEDPERGVFVKDLSAFEITTVEQLRELIQKGNLNRTMAPTSANQFSSRSHALLQLYIEHGSESRVFSKLSLIDLAGSERGASAQNRSQRMFQGSNINKSLLALCNCIMLLSERRSGHVPYRNSKLTHLLKDSLGGSTRTAMIACVSPMALHYEESISTLKYAERARRIKADKVVRNVRAASADKVAHYKSIIQSLQEEVGQLKEQLVERMAQTQPSPPSLYLKLHESREQNSTFLLSKSEVSKIEAPGHQSFERMSEFRDTNSQLIERISKSLVKNIEEYVESNHTLNDLRYEKHLLQLNSKKLEARSSELALVEQEVATKELIMQELSESLEMNLKQRAKLEKMLLTLNQQNASLLQQNAKAFQMENLQLKLRNRKLEEELAQVKKSNDLDLDSEQRDLFHIHKLNQQEFFLDEESSSSTSEVPEQVSLQEIMIDGVFEQARQPSLPRLNLDAACFQKMIEQEKQHRSNSQKLTHSSERNEDRLNTNEQDVDFRIQSIVTPLPTRDRIVPVQKFATPASLRRERTKNSFTLTLPLENLDSHSRAKGQLRFAEAGTAESPFKRLLSPGEDVLLCEDRKHSTFVLNKLESLLNEDVDLKVQVDQQRTHSSADSVVIGSRKTSNTIEGAGQLTEECSSVNFLSPETRRGIRSECKHSTEESKQSEGPNLDDQTLQEHSGRMPPKSTQKSVFPFSQGVSACTNSAFKARLNLAKVNPKIAESGKRDLRNINSGERSRGQTIDTSDISCGPLLSGRQALTSRNTNHVPKLSQYVSNASRGKAPLNKKNGATNYSDLHKKNREVQADKYRTVDVPRGGKAVVGSKKIAPKQLKRNNQSYSLQKTADKRKPPPSARWKFQRGGQKRISPSPGSQDSKFFTSFCSGKKPASKEGYSRNLSAQNRYSGYTCDESELFSRDHTDRTHSNTPSNVRASPSLFSIPQTARQTPVVQSGRFVQKNKEQMKDALFAMTRENKKSRAITPKHHIVAAKPTFSPLIGANPLKTSSNASQQPGGGGGGGGGGILENLTTSTLFSPLNVPPVRSGALFAVKNSARGEKASLSSHLTAHDSHVTAASTRAGSSTQQPRFKFMSHPSLLEEGGTSWEQKNILDSIAP